jgi:pimeloyl-ACP methyl ester carboxylesterase
MTTGTSRTEGYADVGGGITICYEAFGDPSDPTLLLVMGLGAQMLSWEEDFCGELAGHGYHVVRYDNRDAGLSTFMGAPVNVFEVLQQLTAGADEFDVPYLISDMARDGVGLLDHLGVDRAHIIGASLGGMIAQAIAIEHPERVLTLTSIMSSTGNMEVGQPAPEALGVLLQPPPQTRDEMAARRIASAEVFGSPGLWDPEDLRRKAERDWDRKHDAEGVARQLAAILASGSREDHLPSVGVPTLVIHGTADTLVTPTGGQRTAELIPGATLLMIDGMGHDMPRVLWPQVIGAITTHTATR